MATPQNTKISTDNIPDWDDLMAIRKESSIEAFFSSSSSSEPTKNDRKRVAGGGED